MFVARVRLLEALLDCARHGPSEVLLARVGGIVSRAVRQDEPQWAVPWLSGAALAQAWAGHDDQMRASVAAMLSMADRAADPDLSLTLLCGGFPSAATVLLLARDRERLGRMALRLEGLDAHAGERELLEAFGLWLDGHPPDAPLGVAMEALRGRGIELAVPFAAWAMRAVRPEAALPEPLRSAAQEVLRKAEAPWLAAQLGA